MNIALLNERILIQKNEVVVDDIGNHTNAWTDYYSCRVTVGGTSESAQKEVAGQIVDDSCISFTMRFSLKVASVNNTGFRVIFHDEIYDIVAIDPMNYRKRSFKLRCKKARR